MFNKNNTIFVCLVMFLLYSISFANAEGTAKGVVEVNGKKSEIKYSYLQVEPHDTYKTAHILIFSDVKLTKEQLESHFSFNRLAKEGKFNGLLIKVDPEKDVFSANIYSDAFNFLSYTSISGVNEFEAEKFSKDHIKGKAFMKKPWKGSFEDSDEIFYDISFDVKKD